MSADDAELVRRCLAGVELAVRELVERFHGDVYGLCVRVLNHRHDAEDVAQEVFLRVFRSLNRWDGVRPLRPWILGIAVNRCRTHLGKRSKRPETVDFLQDTVARDDGDGADEMVREIRAAVAELRPDYRAAFTLFHERGSSYEEIATALERPVGTIKTWLHRARLAVLTRLRERGMVPLDEPDPA